MEAVGTIRECAEHGGGRSKYRYRLVLDEGRPEDGVGPDGLWFEANCWCDWGSHSILKVGDRIRVNYEFRHLNSCPPTDPWWQVEVVEMVKVVLEKEPYFLSGIDRQIRMPMRILVCLNPRHNTNLCQVAREHGHTVMVAGSWQKALPYLPEEGTEGRAQVLVYDGRSECWNEHAGLEWLMKCDYTGDYAEDVAREFQKRKYPFYRIGVENHRRVREKSADYWLFRLANLEWHINNNFRRFPGYTCPSLSG